MRIDQCPSAVTLSFLRELKGIIDRSLQIFDAQPHSSADTSFVSWSLFKTVRLFHAGIWLLWFKINSAELELLVGLRDVL